MPTRTLTFEDRVRAQEAIERVYQAHRIGAGRSFQEAVPRPLIERHVLNTLAESSALERVWRTPITGKMLRRELARIAASTRFPDRLNEVYDALGRDPFLIQETFVRASLADRLARSHVKMEEWDSWLESARENLVRSDVVVAADDQDGALPQADNGAVAAACTIEDVWSGGGSPAGPPSPRYGHSAVWTGSEMIVWGGDTNLNTGARYDPITDTWGPTAVAGAPEGRGEHSAVWTGSRMIVWGGSIGGSPIRTGGQYDPVSDTWTATSSVDAPSARWEQTVVWTGQVMIIWGGSGGNYTGGRYDPTTNIWSPTSTVNVPQTTNGHAAVWTGTEMIVWGGDNTTGGRYNPVTDTWTPTSTTNAPNARSLPSAVWTGQEMVVWGGTSGGLLPTGGRYNPSTDSWRPTSLTSAPVNRYRHVAVWTGGRMIIWGGIDNSHSPPSGNLNSGARYDPESDTWTSTTMIGAPSARAGHTGVWTGSEVIVWGGTADTTGGRYHPASDSWEPTGTTVAYSLSPRYAQTAVWTGSEMIVWGGVGASALGDGGRYDPLVDTWAPTSLSSAPSPRSAHTAVWTGSEMIVWGGQDNIGQPLGTGARYDPVHDSWAPTSQTGSPSSRKNHAAVWTGQQMIVWGGAGGGSLDTGALYDPTSDNWSPTSQAGAPGARSGHTAVWTGREMAVWGGSPANPGPGTGGRYDPIRNSWSPISLVDAPSRRAWHTAVWSGSEMIVWGGYSGGSLGDGGRYDPTLDTWMALPAGGAPRGRFYHTAVWTGSEMIIWGGAYVSDFYIFSVNTGARYDPSANSWTAASTTSAPEPRDLHTAVWIDGVMIVRGGEHYSGDVASLAADPYVSWYGNGASQPSRDDDNDGFRLCDGDCDDANPVAWATPGEVRNLVFTDDQTLVWDAPIAPGGALVYYDTLRSLTPTDFLVAGSCTETRDPQDSMSLDAEAPPAGMAFYYLVRADSQCVPGEGPLGFASDGTPTVGRSCQ